jgi:uncharacterized protein (TIGR03435 family)
MSRCKLIARCLCLTSALTSIALAQPSFEVASVKRHDPKNPTFSPPTCENNRFTSRGPGVLQILAWAYDLRSLQFFTLEESLPPWTRTEGYDIEAVAHSQMTASECRQAVQRLFLDRFKMKSHWKRIPDAPGYDLTVSPKGHKLKPLSPTDTGCGVHIALQGDERECDRYQWPFAVKRGMSMAEFVRVLSIYTSHNPVRDKTGLSGEYKISLSFTTRQDNTQYPLLEQALLSQLGLVMRPSKADADVLIVDSIDRPTAN